MQLDLPQTMQGTLSRQAWMGLVLAASVAALTVSAGCRGNKSAEPPVHLNQNMDFQQYYQAQEKTELFADGRTMRPYVEGTVARGMDAGEGADLLKDDDHLYRGRGADGRLADALPESLPLTAALLDRGEERYGVYCTPCHGPAGAGQGIVMKRGFAVPAPSYHEDRLKAMPLGYFYDVITHGKGTMMPYAAQIPVADRWAIAAYVRALQVSDVAALVPAPAEEGSK